MRSTGSPRRFLFMLFFFRFLLIVYIFDWREIVSPLRNWKLGSEWPLKLPNDIREEQSLVNFSPTIPFNKDGNESILSAVLVLIPEPFHTLIYFHITVETYIIYAFQGVAWSNKLGESVNYCRKLPSEPKQYFLLHPLKKKTFTEFFIGPYGPSGGERVNYLRSILFIFRSTDPGLRTVLYLHKVNL